MGTLDFAAAMVGLMVNFRLQKHPVGLAYNNTIPLGVEKNDGLVWLGTPHKFLDHNNHEKNSLENHAEVLRGRTTH
jgi:hypothetical protein